MAEPRRALPEFSEPPVIETLLGVQFSPLDAFTVPHFGLYWERIRDEYPKAEVQPPLRPIVERFGAEAQIGEVRSEVAFVTVPEVRCWFIDQSETRLIQVQRDRFIQNWRKVKGDEAYPRYRHLKPKFEEEWKRFCHFLGEEKLGDPGVDQCEVTYVNHIEIGRGLRSFGEIGAAVAYWSGTSFGDFLPAPETVSLNAQFVIPENRGRLYVAVRPAIRQRDPKEVLQLTLTARGRPQSSALEDIVKWFDLGHDWIVKGFTDFTTRRMHELWGRRT